MRTDVLNIVYVAFGLLFSFISIRALMHHEYEYFTRLRQMRIPYWFLLLFGVCILLLGVIGLVRASKKVKPRSDSQAR